LGQKRVAVLGVGGGFVFVCFVVRGGGYVGGGGGGFGLDGFDEGLVWGGYLWWCRLSVGRGVD